jgi:diguanylate cyclase
VHIIWISLYIIFILPILLTVVYTNYALTTVTAISSIAAKIISDLFITWDPDKMSPFQSTLGATNFVISICIMTAFYAACMIVIRFETEKKYASIQKEIERYQIQQKLTIDELTNIYNRTALRKAFQNMEKDFSDNTYFFVMIDLDNFKTLNDTLGHEKGDQCLKEFGSILKRNCVNAIPFRFGGDEFCILSQNKTMEELIENCKSIQKDLKESAINQLGISLTASIGIARYSKHMTTTQLLRNTDSALYHSKESKNSICVFDDLDHFSDSK